MGGEKPPTSLAWKMPFICNFLIRCLVKMVNLSRWSCYQLKAGNVLGQETQKNIDMGVEPKIGGKTPQNGW